MKKVLEAKLEASDQRWVNLLFEDVSIFFFASLFPLEAKKVERVCRSKIILPGALFTSFGKFESMAVFAVALSVWTNVGKPL